RDHLDAEEGGEDQHRQLEQEPAADVREHRHAVSFLVTQAPAVISSSQSSTSSPSGARWPSSACTLRAYSRLASDAISLGRFVGPTIVTPLSTTVSPGLVSSQFPPVAAARSTITEPGRIASTALAGISFGDGRGSDHRVEVRQALLELGLLLSLLLRRQLLGVPAFGLLAADAEVEEPGAERLDLLADDVAHVEPPGDGPEPACGRERLQPGDAGADHEHL